MTEKKHFDILTLELYVLGAPEGEALREEISLHVERCQECRSVVDEINTFYAGVTEDISSSGSLVGPGSSPIRWNDDIAHRGIARRGRRFRAIETAIPIRMARWVLRHPLAAGGAGTLVAFLIGWLAFNLMTRNGFSPINGNPVEASYERGVILLRDENGTTIGRINAGTHTAAIDGSVNLVRCADIDGDGINEVIWVQSRVDRDDRMTHVFCTSFPNHQVRWEYPLIRKFVVPQHPEAAHDSYGARCVLVDDCDLDGRAEVYIVTYGDFFPSYIVKLDAGIGKELGCYFHTGHIQTCRSVDLDGDGKKELVIGGINNSLESAFFAVLDPSRLDGHGPVGPGYDVTGITPAREILYVPIPRTVVSLAFGDAIRWNSLEDIQVNPADRTIRLVVNDAPFIQEPKRGTVYLGFTFGLRPFFVGLGDDYMQLTREAMRRGLIENPPDTSYFNAFLKELPSWEDGRWSGLLPLNSPIPF